MRNRFTEWAIASLFTLCAAPLWVGMWLVDWMEEREEKKRVPPSAGLRPEEGERPFPGPTVVHLSLSDRIERKHEASPEELEGLKRAMRKLREQWGDQVAAEELIREIDREWDRT